MQGDHGEYVEMFVFLTEGEGVAGFNSGGTWFPMVTYRADVAEKMKGRAQDLARISGKTIELVRFSQPEVLATWKGAAAMRSASG